MAAIARGEQRRALIIAAAGFVLVLGLFVGSRVLGGGGDDVAGPLEPPTSEPQTTPGTPPTGAPAPGGAVPVIPIPPVAEPLEALELRDPFTPPLTAIELLRALLPVGPSPGPAPAPGGGTPSTSPGSVILRSVDMVNGEEVGTIDVDGTLYEASEGDRFGPNEAFSVVTLDAGADCGTFLFGDEAFSLCVGQAPQAPPAPGSTPQK